MNHEITILQLSDRALLTEVETRFNHQPAAYPHIASRTLLGEIKIRRLDRVEGIYENAYHGDEYFNLKSDMKALADSVVAIVNQDQLEWVDDQWRLHRSANRLCAMPEICGFDRLVGQPGNRHIFSGVLVNGNRVATCKHALQYENDPNNLRCLLGYWHQSNSSIKNDYFNFDRQQVLALELHAQGSTKEIQDDWAVFLVTDPPPVAKKILLPVTPIIVGTPVLSGGFPLGMPGKLVTGGKIEKIARGNNAQSLIVWTKLDLFAGCSGSPLLTAKGELLGVLGGVQAGDTFHRPNEDCYEPDVYGNRVEGHYFASVEQFRSNLSNL